MRRLGQIAGLIAVVGLTGCPPEHPDTTPGAAAQMTEDGDTPVARVNGEVITAKEYEARIETMPDFAREEFRSLPRRKQYLVPLVDFELLADEAEKRGYGDDPRVVDTMKAYLAAKAVEGKDRDALVEKLRTETPPNMNVSAVEKALSEKSK